MIFGRIYRENDHQILLDRVMLTTNPWDRMRGLLGRPEPKANEGLVIQPCSSIHTLGMRYPIDVIYLDHEWRVIKLVDNLATYRMSWCRDARRVLEITANNIKRLQLKPGMKLGWEDL